MLNACPNYRSYSYMYCLSRSAQTCITKIKFETSWTSGSLYGFSSMSNYEKYAETRQDIEL